MRPRIKSRLTRKQSFEIVRGLAGILMEGLQRLAKNSPEAEKVLLDLNMAALENGHQQEYDAVHELALELRGSNEDFKDDDAPLTMANVKGTDARLKISYEGLKARGWGPAHTPTKGFNCGVLALTVSLQATREYQGHNLSPTYEELLAVTDSGRYRRKMRVFEEGDKGIHLSVHGMDVVLQIAAKHLGAEYQLAIAYPRGSAKDTTTHYYQYMHPNEKNATIVWVYNNNRGLRKDAAGHWEGISANQQRAKETKGKGKEVIQID